MATRLAPSVSLDTQFFWDGVREHRLLIQRCGGCGALRHPPRPMCPECQSLAWDSVEASGRGTLYSFCIPRHPLLPWQEEEYVVALVELDEGTRLVSNLVGVDPAEARIGMPVRVVFEEFDDGLVLPMFTPEETR